MGRLRDVHLGEHWPLLFGVLLVVAVVASFHLVAIGFLVPLDEAASDASQHDLRGPYFGALDLGRGDNPYEPGSERRSDVRARRLGLDRMTTLYAPPVLVLYLPLADMSLRRAKVVFLAISFTCLLGAMAALAWSAPSPRALSALVMLPLVAGATEVFTTLSLGQVNIIILFLLAFGFAALEKGHARIGGSAIGLATLIKPIPAILLLGLGLRRQWRALAAGIVAIVVLLSVTIVCFGWTVHQSFLRTAFQAGSNVQADSENQNLASFLIRTLSGSETTDASAVTPVGRVLWATTAALIAGVTGYCSVRRPRTPLRITLSMFLVTGLVLSTRTLIHYYVWALIPVAFALFELARRRRWGAIVLLGVAYNCMFKASRRWEIGTPPFDGAMLTITSIPFFGLMLVLGILVYLHIVDTTVDGEGSLVSPRRDLQQDGERVGSGEGPAR